MNIKPKEEGQGVTVQYVYTQYVRRTPKFQRDCSKPKNISPFLQSFGGMGVNTLNRLTMFSQTNHHPSSLVQ